MSLRGRIWNSMFSPWSALDYTLERIWNSMFSPWSALDYTLELFKRKGKWSSRIKHHNGEILWSSTSQIYSRKTDARQTARRFSEATGVPVKEIAKVPKVGSGSKAKHYAYSKKGVAAAKKEAKRTGKPMTKKRRR